MLVRAMLVGPLHSIVAKTTFCYCASKFSSGSFLCRNLSQFSFQRSLAATSTVEDKQLIRRAIMNNVDDNAAAHEHMVESEEEMLSRHKKEIRVLHLVLCNWS